MQIKKEMNDDVEQHVTAPSWQCHKLTVLVALARGCTALWGTPGDYGRTTASTVPHSLLLWGTRTTPKWEAVVRP